MGIRQLIKVEAHDANTFLALVEEMVELGGKVLVGAPFLSIPYEASFEFINKEYVPARIGVVDFGRQPISQEGARKYSEGELIFMEWDAFRELCKAFGIKGRERSAMIDQYLKLQG